MEEVTMFDRWLKDFIAPKIEYFAIYDPKTYAVIGVYPGQAASLIENKVLIDIELAKKILEGHLSLSSCFVDISDETIEIVQTHTVVKIDDILHRVPNRCYTIINDEDLNILFDETEKCFKFSLSDKIKNKKIHWAGDTELQFLITEYNDPHKIYQVIQFKLEDLYKNNLLINYTGDNLDFSIFTSRIFKKYIFEKQ